MKHKRGQVSIYVLLGIVMLVLTGFIFYASPDKKTDTFLRNNLDIKSVTSFMNECLQQKSEEALIEIAEKGGHFSLPVYSTEQVSENLPYFLYQGSTFVPPIEEIQESVARAVKKRLSDCMNFSRFEEMNIITKAEPKIEVTFTPDEMRVTMHQRIVMQEGQSETRIESVTASVPTIFLWMYEHAKKIVEIHEQSGEYVCLSCLRKLNEANRFTTKTAITPEGFLYALEENKKDNTKGIIFRFAVKA